MIHHPGTGTINSVLSLSFSTLRFQHQVGRGFLAFLFLQYSCYIRGIRIFVIVFIFGD